jgi:hypothetical protein
VTRALAYDDFYRTGVQDCGNVLSVDEFDLRAGGTAEEIVERTWAEWEADGMEEQWLEQQDDLEGLDPHQCYDSWKVGWKSCAVATLEEHVERAKERRLDDEAFERETSENPVAGWWRKRPKKDLLCYPTKSAALAMFLDVNYEIVENYGGADYKVGPSEFDSINRKYGLKGSRAARSISDAVWAAMPVGKPYCLDRIDLDALNDTSPVHEAGVPFRLPDYVHEAQMAEQEARRIGYGQAEPDPEEPSWVTEHRRFPALPPLPYRLQLEEQEPGVATFSMHTDEEGEPMPAPPRARVSEIPSDEELDAMLDSAKQRERPYPSELVQEQNHFNSGINDKGEIKGLLLSGRNIGITASNMRPGMIDALEMAPGIPLSRMTKLFVDSGAFSELVVTEREDGPPLLSWPKPITDAGWRKRFKIYDWAAHTYRKRAYLVAPDQVGNQKVTLERLARYGAEVASWAAMGANIIVVAQKDPNGMDLGSFFQEATSILGLRPEFVIAGIPSEKARWTQDEVRAFAETLPEFGARVHLLGVGPKSKRDAGRKYNRYWTSINTIKSVRPNCEIFSDSALVPDLVGRGTGRASRVGEELKGDRIHTRLQDEARLRGLSGSDVKEYGILGQGALEAARDRQRAEDAGWFDDETYGSIEEARAHRLAGYPDQEPEPVPPPRVSQPKPYRLQLEEREPGVETYSINPPAEIHPSKIYGKKVRVHYNLHRCPRGRDPAPGEACWVVSTKVDGAWKVAGYVPSLLIADAEFQVSKPGVVRIREQQSRSVVAWIVGTAKDPGSASAHDSGWTGVGFNPFKSDHFYLYESGKAIEHAPLVYVSGRKAITKPGRGNPSSCGCGSKRQLDELARDIGGEIEGGEDMNENPSGNPPPGEHPRRRKFKKPRTGVHVDASSPTMFRELTRIAIPSTARREGDGSFTVFDEARWKAIMSSCEAHEVESPKQNPAWVTKILSKHFVKLEEEVPPRFLPKITKAAFSRGGRISATMKEYGCGAYGCVLPTLDPSVVLKLTTDDTEAEFANDLAGKLAKPVVVKYHMTRELPDKYKGRPSFLLWRDAADHVGEVEQTIAEESGVDPTVVEEAIGNQHLAAQAAFEALDEGEPAVELLQKWEEAAREMGEKVPELRELAEGMIANLKKNKVFMGDVHSGNIGRVNGHWVVVDPGHIAVLTA